MNATPYRDGTALWRGLGDRARVAAKVTGRPVNELLRRFVYDRFLARVFDQSDAGWVLKGGTAVLARVHDARHSMDVDLLRRNADLDEALLALRAAVAVDLGDHFRFVAGAGRRVGGPQQPNLIGYRVQVEAYCGVRRCETFGVDLVTGSLMTAEPELVRSSSPLQVPGLEPPLVHAYPVVDHIADKVAATESRYADGSQSTRVRDLVDLVILTRTQEVDGSALQIAISAERLNRGLAAVTSFVVPVEWGARYPKMAAGTPHCRDLADMGEAVRLVATLVEPAMNGTAGGLRWLPSGRRWE